jgi:outer membrane protein
MTKKLLIAIACLLPMSLFAQEQKFGYFNRAEIFQSMPETTVATKKIDELAKNYETELVKMQDEYQKKGADFVAAKDSLPEAIKVRRMTEIQDLEQRLQSFYTDSQKEIQKTQQELVVPINTKLATAVKAVGQDQGFIYIFDTSVNAGLMYWSLDKCVDVTNLVRAKLNLK